MFSLN
ncbi:hypothetical protein D030_0455A, partial [Vibrio parahaemolyticus AQ3810]